MKTIAVLDFGGQYTHLIATRVRSLGIKADILAPETFSFEHVPDLVGIIFSGSPHSVCEANSPRVNFPLKDCPVPILGLCYGHQLLAELLGGKVVPGKSREYGAVEITTSSAGAVFADLPTSQVVWMSHGDVVSVLPPGAHEIAWSHDVRHAGFQSADGRCIGLQFHPEVVHTHHGTAILDRFLSLCSSDRPWQPGAFREEIIEQIRLSAGDAKLLLLLSGGVDSLVALKLCLEAVGADRVLPIHVDTGLMRLNESAEILRHLAAEGFTGIRLVKAEDRFLQELAGVADPEAKRGIIGRLFVEVVEETLGGFDLAHNWMLVQGTIYPDRIESGGTRRADKIKTHHNRVAEIEKLIAAGRVIEPLGNLYKDEVRRLGRELGLPAVLVDRHPFPGPGLGIRVLCSNGDQPAPGWNQEEAEAKTLLAEFHLDGSILPVKSVGVQGDSRTYLHPLAVWPKAGFSVGFDQLLRVARKITNRLRTVNRVVWSPVPLTHGILLQEAYVTRARLDHLRRIDALVRERTLPYPDIWQLPVVSLPAVMVRDTAHETADESADQIVVIRPITSKDAMTAEVFPLPENVFHDLFAEMNREHQVGALLYDLTSKPPGTIEWE